jgi:hypothetical protein
MSPVPIVVNGDGVDLSGRISQSKAIVASPALAAETTICTVTIGSNPSVLSGIVLLGWVSFTVGTSGVSANLKIRQTGTSGATIVATGVQTVTAATIVETGCQGFDAAPLAAGVYVLTLTIGSGAAASTVSAVQLLAFTV